MANFFAEGFMPRFVPPTVLVCVLAGCAFLSSCSSSSPTRVVGNPVPDVVALTPAPNVSIEVGKTLTFTASARNSTGNLLSETFTYQSTNPSIVTVANNGIACAGVWDSLTSPVVCTPGGTGVSQVTAIANGVASPPVTVYAHQHVTKVVVQEVPAQPPTLSSVCFSRDLNHLGPEKVLYEAFAYGGPGGTTDLTATVGQFTWTAAFVSGQALSSAPVTLSSLGSGAPLNRELASAAFPGTTSIIASAGGVNSQPIQFTTCPVQSIALQLAPGSALAFSVGRSATVNAIVKDSVGMDITGIPLTWFSTDPKAVSVGGASSTVYGGMGTVSGSAAGRAGITASCTPPSCNGGFIPSMPIYPTAPLVFQVTSNSAPPLPTAYVTTSACSGTTLSCTSRVVPITRSGTASQFSAGTPISLPSVPNSSMLGANSSGTLFLGTDTVGFNSEGLMVFSGASVSQLANAAGRVLAVSPDSSTVILYDTADSPSRINICKNCGGSLRAFSTFFFSNVTAAAFSPDSLKAYIVSNSPCPGALSGAGCILVYSQVDSAQFVSLSAPATDAAFIGNGTLGYVAETTAPNSFQAEFLPTCGPSTTASLGNANLQAQYLRPLSDGMSLLALTPPNVQTVTATVTGNPTMNQSGCPFPRGFLSITHTVGPTVSLNPVGFTVKQFFVSPDGSTAYILAQTATGSYFPFVFTFNVASGTTSQISLVGSAIPLSAAISRVGDLLFVGADDNSVHVVDTSTGLDTQQVPLTFPGASLCVGPGNPVTQVYVASLTISAAQQVASNTIFAYSLSNGSTPQVGQSLVLTGMTDSGNNGTFTILAVNAATSSTGTVTVSNPAGVTASGQAGTGTVPLSCNPDLVVTVP